MSDGNYKDEANVSWTPESDSFFVLKFSSAEMADRLEPWALTQMLVCDRRGLQFCHPAEQQIPRTANQMHDSIDFKAAVRGMTVL
jgi:hypothetical protein